MNPMTLQVMNCGFMIALSMNRMFTKRSNLTTGKVAKRLGVAHTTVLAMIARGEIKAQRIGHWWRIPASEVERIEKGR